MTLRAPIRICTILLVLSAPALLAAQQAPIDTALLSRYRAEVRRMVSFLEFTLNTVGDPLTTTRQKETIFNESYLKFFRDSEVQIEDDLVEGRSTVTNKHIQAYLKDIDFFFREVRFAFEIEEISHEVNDEGLLYFRVTAHRRMQGIGIEGDTLRNVQLRYIEINLDPAQQQLKIASIYTTRLSEEEVLAQWWNDLPTTWRAIFAPRIPYDASLTFADLLQTDPGFRIGDTLLRETETAVVIRDSLTLNLFIHFNPSLFLGDTFRQIDTDTLYVHNYLIFDNLRALHEQEELDLSDHPELDDFAPLSRFTRLRRLDLGGCGIIDLLPLRNLTRLEFLDLSRTPIRDLSPLRYTVELRELDLSGSLVADLDPVAAFPRLAILRCAGTPVTSLTPLIATPLLRELDCQRTGVSSLAPLAQLPHLEVLKCSRTGVLDLAPLHQLRKLETLYCEETRVADLSPLAACTALRVLLCDGTRIQSLAPLDDLPQIRKVYCDGTRVDRREAARFLIRQPDCLLVFESAALQVWWSDLPAAWKNFFRERHPFVNQPDRELLHQVASMREIDISHRSQIGTLAPLRMLNLLEVLRCADTPIDTLAPLSELTELRLLDCSHTAVRSLEPLRDLRRLQQIDCSDTRIADLAPLATLTSLEVLAIERCPVATLAALHALPRIQRVLAEGTALTDTTVQRLLIARPGTLVIYRSALLETWWNTLDPAWQDVMRQHVRISEPPGREELHLLTSRTEITIQNNLQITTLEPLTLFLALRKLSCVGTSVVDLHPLAGLTTLQQVQCAQNPLYDLLPLATLRELRYLDVSNTPVRDLAPLAGLTSLEELRCGSTAVRTLKDLAALTRLRLLDCANTAVSSLSPLKDLQALELLKCFNTRVSTGQVAKFRETHPGCEVIHY